MKYTHKSLSLAALSALMVVSTRCANNTFDQVLQDVKTGAKIGLASGVLMSGSHIVANKIKGCDQLKNNQAAPLVLPVVATSLGIQHVDKIANPTELKEASLTSRVTQVVAGVVAMFGTQYGICWVADILGIKIQ